MADLSVSGLLARLSVSPLDEAMVREWATLLVDTKQRDALFCSPAGFGELIKHLLHFRFASSTSSSARAVVDADTILDLVRTHAPCEVLVEGIGGVALTTFRPEVRREAFGFLLEWVQAQGSRPGFPEKVLVHFDRIQHYLVRGLCDVWSQIRKMCNGKLASLVLLLEATQRTAVFLDLLQTCEDEVEPNANAWKAKEGAIAAIGTIVAASGPAGRVPLMSIVTEAKRSELSVALFRLLSHPQQTLRQNCSKTLEQLLSSCAFAETEACLSHVLERLGKTSQAAGGTVTELGAYDVEGLLSVLDMLIQSVLPFPYVLDHWGQIYPVVYSQLAHTASSVRQTASNITDHFITRSYEVAGAPARVIRLLLQCLAANWPSPFDAGHREAASGQAMGADFRSGVFFSLPPSFPGSDLSPTKPLSVNAVAWEWMEGRMFCYEALLRHLLSNHAISLKNHASSREEPSTLTQLARDSSPHNVTTKDDTGRVYSPLPYPYEPNTVFSDPAAEEGTKGIKSVPLTVVLEELVHQMVQCSASEQWELQRMADQVWEPLVQVLLWFDDGLLLEHVWTANLSASSTVLQRAGILALKHTLKVVLGWRSGHLDESKRIALDEVVVVQPTEVTLARIQRRICEAAPAVLKLGRTTACERVASLAAEVLTLACCQCRSDVADTMVPSYVNFVVQRLTHLRQLDTASPEHGAALRVESWLLSATSRSLPALARVCPVPQRWPLLRLLCDYARRRQDTLLLASITEAIGALHTCFATFSPMPTHVDSNSQEIGSYSTASTLLLAVDALIHVMRGYKEASQRKLGFVALGKISARCVEASVKMPVSLLHKVLLVLANGILHDHGGRVPTAQQSMVVMDLDSEGMGSSESTTEDKADGDGDWSDWDEDEEEDNDASASGTHATLELAALVLILSKLRLEHDRIEAQDGVITSAIEDKSAHASFQDVLAAIAEPHKSCIDWALI